MVLSCNHYLTGLADCQQGLSYDFFRFLYAPPLAERWLNEKVSGEWRGCLAPINTPARPVIYDSRRTIERSDLILIACQRYLYEQRMEGIPVIPWSVLPIPWSRWIFNELHTVVFVDGRVICPKEKLISTRAIRMNIWDIFKYSNSLWKGSTVRRKA